MRVLAVDDEAGALRLLEHAITTVDPDINVISFQTGSECLVYCKTHECPMVAFLDIRIGSMSGLELALELKKINMNINIIFTTGFSEYKGDALDQRASGYLLKPITPAMIAEELDNLRHPIEHKNRGLFVKAFGTFELFYDGVPVKFKYEKTKELFAYLFDRQGAMCQNEAVKVILWDDEGHENYFRQLKKDLSDTLEELGCGLVVVRRRGGIGLDMKQLHSDYQDFIQGTPTGINAYHGEYMAQFSWAEETNASLWKDL